MTLHFDPPYLNSAGPWATSKEDLQSLYDCQYTGAITTRTGTLQGFPQDPKVHAWHYFDARSNAPLPERSPNANSTIKSLGYSPKPLDEILRDVQAVVKEAPTVERNQHRKPIIVSVTGSADEVSKCYERVAECRRSTGLNLLLEVNVSCPNIHNKPPPAYDEVGLQEYLLKLQNAMNCNEDRETLLVGIKIPPYTYTGQFHTLINALQATVSEHRRSGISFITSTNTLGNCLVLAPASDRPALLTASTTPSQTAYRTSSNSSQALGEPSYVPGLTSESGTGHGGIGGAAIHPLSLGNVAQLRRLLDQHEELRHIQILGVGGVSNWEGVARMRSVGAAAVGIGTAVGKDGLEVFQKIAVEAAG